MSGTTDDRCCVVTGMASALGRYAPSQMWLGDVDIPSELVEAHRAGSLVLFIGAGASIDPPSSLPDFWGLTARIVAESHVVVPEEGEQPDSILGRLVDRDVDVHRRIHSAIGAPTSQPNRLHRAVVDLARSGPQPRIVTTNYDAHLTRAAADVGLVFDEFVGPALPMGDDFSGLVYLHGSLRQEPRRLVVTDRDFGRAYLSDAWAARFLERMFSAYSVLFIGYSLGDVVMRYMSRALRPGRSRFILTSNPEDLSWRALGVNTVGYGLREGSHEELSRALERWAESASMGLLDHKERIEELVARSPAQQLESASYLASIFEDEHRTSFFANAARGLEWLTWAAAQPAFKLLFSADSASDPVQRTLADWFVDCFVLDREASPIALQVMRTAGGQLSVDLWWALAQRLHLPEGPRPPWLEAWLVLVIRDARDERTDLLDLALTTSAFPENRASALLLFDRLSEPQAAPGPSLGGSTPRFELSVSGSETWLPEAWTKVLRPHLDDLASDVLAIADRHLRRAALLTSATSGGARLWDPVSSMRSAIEPHPQDEYPQPIDTLIDAARDSLEVLFRTHPTSAAGYIESWAASQSLILRRLAVHGWTERSDIDSAEKLGWLEGTTWLFDYQVRHEVFRLIHAALQDAPQAAGDALVDQVEQWPDLGDPQTSAYEPYNALVWITRAAPNLASARAALDRRQEEHPDFGERAHPDLIAYHSSGAWGPVAPMSPEALHQLIETDPSAAIDALRDRAPAERQTIDSPTWSDALSLIASTVTTHPADGLRLLETAGDELDVARAVIDGWSRTELTDELATSALSLLLDAVQRSPSLASAIAFLLRPSGNRGTPSTRWQARDATRSAFADLWALMDQQPLDAAETDDDWMHVALSDPAGALTELWIHAVGDDRAIAGDRWNGLTDELRAGLETVLATPGETRTAIAQIALAAQLQFLYTADAAWTEGHLLPLMAWDDPPRAARLWAGFLAWGRWNDRLLSAGLLEGYLGAAEHAQLLGDRRRKDLVEHIRNVILEADIDATAWLRQLTARAAPELRFEVLQSIGWALTKLDPAEVELQWDRWMRPYWEDRLNSIPVVLNEDEASALATWVPHLTASLHQGIRLAVSHPAHLLPHGGLLRSLSAESVAASPREYVRFVAHLLRSTDGPLWGSHNLQQIVESAAGAADPADLRALVEEAVRLGFHAATTWQTS